jgi:hypothetical protein
MLESKQSHMGGYPEKRAGRVKQSLRVDSALFRNEYEAQKLELYSAAISTWNKLDGSTRQRIPVK